VGKIAGASKNTVLPDGHVVWLEQMWGSSPTVEKQTALGQSGNVEEISHTFSQDGASHHCFSPC